jgi:hypothetical protein
VVGVEVGNDRPSQLPIKLFFRRNSVRVLMQKPGEVYTDADWQKESAARKRSGDSNTKGVFASNAQPGVVFRIGTPALNKPQVTIRVIREAERFFLEVENLTGKELLTGRELEVYLQSGKTL